MTGCRRQSVLYCHDCGLPFRYSGWARKRLCPKCAEVHNQQSCAKNKLGQRQRYLKAKMTPMKPVFVKDQGSLTRSISCNTEAD